MNEYTNLFAKIQQEAKLDMDLTDLVPFGTEGSGNQIKVATIMHRDTPQLRVSWNSTEYSSFKSEVLTDSLNIKILPMRLRGENATFKDFYEFCESRCAPRTRYNIDEILHRYGLREYDPVAMCRKSYGRTMADYLWIKWGENSTLTWKDIGLRK